MNVLETLMLLANSLDKKGQFELADEVDAIIKQAFFDESAPDQIEAVEPESDVEEVIALLQDAGYDTSHLPNPWEI